MRNKIILSKDLVFKISHELRKQGKVVGFTHGAFDLFHTSHLDLLLKSSHLCDFLIVAVDVDENISKYKGYSRPIVPQDQRMRIISELNCVDATFIKTKDFYDSNSMQDLYKELKPSFISIGQNFGAEDKIKLDTDKSKIKLIKLDTIQENSTTQLVNKIIKLHKLKYGIKNKVA